MRRTTAFARVLRQAQTAPEELLWSHLRARRLGGFKFRRQAPLDRFVVDFLCVEAKVIVEVDGPTHDTRAESDAARTNVFTAMGYLVLLRANVDGVLDEIFHTLEQRGLRDG